LGKKTIYQETEDKKEKEWLPFYTIPTSGENPLLRDAVLHGVPCIILSNEIPLKDRTKLCELLNRKSDWRWPVLPGENYERPKSNVDPQELQKRKDVVIDIQNLREVDIKQSQFELLSKTLDGLELNCLVRQEVRQSASSERAGH